MARTMLLAAVSIFALISLCSHIALSADEEQWSLHKAAQQCNSQPCDTLECRIECDQVCANCHGLVIDVDLSGVSEWNPTGTVIYEVYPVDNTLINDFLKDTCMDCHQGHSEVVFNHPVEIAYPPEEDMFSEPYNSSPDGPHLLCDASEENCVMSCITCHKVHPSEDKGQQLIGLLRMSNEGSALCISCHVL